MKKTILYFSLIFIGYLGFSQNIQRIESEQFQNSDFEKAIPASEFQNAQIVALGEPVHRGGNSNTAKIKMVKYLHEKCGYNVLAMEACMFKMIGNDKQVADGTYTGDSLIRTVSPAWSTSEMRELYDYVVETRKTENRLAITGFDIMFPYDTHKEVKEKFREFITTLNKRVKNPVVIEQRFDTVFSNLLDKSFGFSKCPPQDTLLLHNTYRDIQERIADNNLKSEKYFRFWNDMVNNLRVIYQYNYNNTLRDKQMFKNLEILMNEYYPNEKVIIWGATAHFVKDSKATDTKWHQKNDYMGDFIQRKYGDKYYMLAFTALEGTAGMKGMLGLLKQKVRTKKGSVERYIEKMANDPDYAFMSLRDSENRKIISENITNTSLLGERPTKTDILKVADGIFYIKEEGLVHWDW